MRRSLLALVVLPAVAAMALSACGAGEDPPAPRLTVAGATSLTEPLTRGAAGFAPARVRLSFAGSDQLASQIRAGARPDVIAAANTTIPAALYREGLVGTPVVFAGNELVVIVPRTGARVRAWRDLARPGVRIAAGAPSVPVGAYARGVLDRLPGGTSRAVRANIRSEEPDVGGVVGKVAQGAVDAGFAYRTDALAASDRVRAITIPPGLRPQVRYAAAIVRGTRNPAEARAYLRDLVSGATGRALRRAGFQAPSP